MLKERDDLEVSISIRSVLRGGAPIDPFIARRIIAELQPPGTAPTPSAAAAPAPLEEPLSAREQQILRLVADTIAAGARAGKAVSVCGEMAGDTSVTRLLLGLGLRSFSMHPSQVLAVKQEILRADAGKLQAWAQAVLDSDEPAELLVE